MKVIFICGSLEPGKDGVGDYTRRLAAELISTGHQVAIIALNDKYSTANWTGFQQNKTVDVHAVRLASSISWKERIVYAKEFIASFNPQWLSLQYVPFSFHPKGLLLNLHSYLKELGKGRKWHIMFHELWVGMETGSSIKFKIWGSLQKRLIKKLIDSVSPCVIHTQSRIYEFQLKKLGKNASRLPLFTNIPVEYSGEQKHKALADQFTMVLFGSIHAGSPVENLVNDIKFFEKKNNKEVILKIVGRCGNEQARWENSFSAAGIKIDVTGEIPANELSGIFANSDLGISTTPIALSEKSGAIAAMRAHGLKVVCVSRPWSAGKFTDSLVFDCVFQYGKEDFESICLMNNCASSIDDVASVSKKLVNSLTFN